MTDVFEEVEENIRRERMAALAKRWGPWAVGAFVAVLAGVGGWQGWTAWQARQTDETSQRLAAARELQETGDFEGAEKAFAALTEKGPAGARAAAHMHRAEALVAQGKLEDALKAFDAAAAGAKEPLLRDSARLKAAYLAADNGDLAVVRPRVQPLIAEAGAFAPLARELLAMEALEAGETETAREAFTAITLTLDAPQSLRRRAEAALSMIGPKPAGADAAPAATPPAQPAPAKPE